METLEERWKSLHLIEDEYKEIPTGDEKLEIRVKRGELCLVGKVTVDQKNQQRSYQKYHDEGLENQTVFQTARTGHKSLCNQIQISAR